MGGLVSRSLEAPEERRDFPHGHVDIVTLGDTTLGRTHDAWMEGDEPWVLIDWTGMTRYAK